MYRLMNAEEVVAESEAEIVFSIQDNAYLVNNCLFFDFERNFKVVETPDRLAKIAREERNQKLSLTDWTQLPDAPVSQSNWAIYRQALRDIPLQDDFPWKIDWPTIPE